MATHVITVSVMLQGVILEIEIAISTLSILIILEGVLLPIVPVAQLVRTLQMTHGFLEGLVDGLVLLGEGPILKIGYYLVGFLLVETIGST